LLVARYRNRIPVEMKRFESNIPALYHKGKLSAGETVRLEAEEGRHLRALRLHRGDPVLLLDGEGGRARCSVTEVERGEARLLVESMVFDEGERAPYIVLALAILADRGRFEWAVEKAVELGVAEIIPLRSERTEGRFNRDRAERIAIAALKQSQRGYLPLLHEPRSFASLLSGLGACDLPLICHESAPTDDTFVSLSKGFPSSGKILIMIGPEGGFSDAEVDAARSASARVISLGPARLRAETAAIVAVVTIECGVRGAECGESP
jgi:16S rRNA (uracil1498-N3)-methyltransferase